MKKNDVICRMLTEALSEIIVDATMYHTGSTLIHGVHMGYDDRVQVN